MPETLDIVHLRTLVAIADCGGFGRAAVALHISQPTVSQHVRTLERRLERTFIEKAGRKARFTPAGERLLVQARRILAVHDDALETLDAASENPLALGLTEPAAEQLLPRLLETLRRAFDDRPLSFSLDRSTHLAEAVARGVVDLAVILGVGGDLPGRQVATLPLDWYAAPGWQPPEGAPIPLVAYSEPCGMRQRALQQLGAFGHEVRVVAESAGLEGVIAAARAGDRSRGAADLAPGLRRRGPRGAARPARAGLGEPPPGLAPRPRTRCRGHGAGRARRAVRSLRRRDGAARGALVTPRGHDGFLPTIGFADRNASGIIVGRRERAARSVDDMTSPHALVETAPTGAVRAARVDPAAGGRRPPGAPWPNAGGREALRVGARVLLSALPLTPPRRRH
ncbi:LysR family transcriptional regulator [Rathayibacter oskolensis]|uniref:LysR family transcriptional regulator n=1 Tax=Rathayibacter oskolensis TaxID=1891671 RepID=UPI00265EDC1A|nr:LysR family transcriptional regulator [Rathayibacter oskolensis]WKK71109.1 LysR family transcriptional regulator [Rathayibacter oskolensis]